MTETEYLKAYDSSKYEKPSVTADILVFTINEEHCLELLLIQRGGHPYKGRWAIPGGFVGIRESVEDAAKRELQEETGLWGIYLEQLYTFGKPDRDPRMRVISAAYMALVPRETLAVQAGDDASDAELFEISTEPRGLKLYSKKRGFTLQEQDLAFDHAEIIRKGLSRLAGKLSYSDLAFEFLKQKDCFTLYELELIHEAISGKQLDKGNFRRDFKRKYVNTGRAELLEEKSSKFSKSPAACYRLID